MTRGRVKWFDAKKGYGFVIGPESQDVFVHFSQIQMEGFRTLKDNQWVEYELVESEKGCQAQGVRSAEPPESEESDEPTPAQRVSTYEGAE